MRRPSRLRACPCVDRRDGDGRLAERQVDANGEVAAAQRPVGEQPRAGADDDAPRALRDRSGDEPVRHLVGRGLHDRRRRQARGHARIVALCAVPILAHLDLDAFFAAVEELEDPALRTQPLVVGGDPQGRGVVATANYVARAASGSAPR